MKNNKVAAIIVNYNMPERADALARYIEKNVKHPCDVIMVDNGSEDLYYGECLWSVRLGDNVQTTNGWLMGLAYADAMEQINGEKYAAYWFLITSAEFTTGDPLTPMMEMLQSDYNLVGVHPQLTEDSTTHWEHLKHPGPAWMIDNIAALYDADWFNSIGRFDARLTYAWGIDLETAYHARTQGKRLAVCGDAEVRKVTDIGYAMDRMGMKAEERQQKATANMNEVFTEKYGHDWRDLLYAVY